MSTASEHGSSPIGQEADVGKRYSVVEGSVSGHCCFKFSVIDTMRPTMNGDGKQMVLDGIAQFEGACECYEREDAYGIASALNTTSTAGR